MSEPSHQHVPPGMLRAYRDGRTTPAETLAVSDALADCAECRTTLAALPLAPAYEEIAAAADHAADADANIAFGDDPIARAEFDDLLAFRREMAGQANKILSPVPVQAQGKTDQKIVPLPKSFWTQSPLAALGAAAAALALLAGGWWMVTQPSTNDDARLLTDQQGHRADLALLSADLREAVTNTLHTGRIDLAPTLAELRPKTGTLAGPSAATDFHALSPVGVVIKDLQPTLRWTPREDATSYEVTLMQEEGEDPSYGRGVQTSWTSHALKLGATYTWQVTALRGEETLDRTPKPPAPEARFRVLGETARTELAKLETQYGQFPLVMAVVYARAGLTNEEAAALDRLAHEHPQSALAQQMRATALAQHVSP